MASSMPAGAQVAKITQLVDLQAYLAAIVECTDDAVISKGLDCIIRTWNGGAERLFGYSAQEVLGRSISVLVPPEREGEAFLLLERARSGENVIGLETKRLCKDGRVIDVSLTISPIRDLNGEIVGVSKIARDISIRKRDEARLREANKNLMQFAYAAAHDLQEPLRGISLSLGALKELSKTHPRVSPNHQGIAEETLIEESLASTQHMISMVRDLFAFTQISDKVNHDFQPIDSAEILERVLHVLAASISENKAKIVYGALPMVRAQATHLAGLLQNLIGNALKYRRKHQACQIEVSAVPGQEGFWTFSVADNGLGFDPAYNELIFGIFKRLHARDEYPGTGIGLALCSRIVTAYGGRIWAEGRPGAGATFYFTLPASGSDGQKAAKRTQIFVVEDNPIDVRLLRHALDKQTSWATAVTFARDGEEAIVYLKHLASPLDERRPDLIVLDLNLPKQDGISVLRAIRSTAGIEDLPVFIYSSSSEDEIKRRVSRAGLVAQRYLTKPADVEQFRAFGDILRESFNECSGIRMKTVDA
jgi:PAS domain S-box-containing protein